MCLSCGCGLPHEDHGDEKHLLYAEVKTVADRDGVPVNEAVERLDEQRIQTAAEAAGISADEARSNITQTLQKME